MRLGKVYYDLNESNYKFEFERFTFIFSSKLYIQKFEKELKNYVNIEEKKLISKYQINLESSEYLALSLYKKIEKRGFKVLFNNIEIDKNTIFSINISLLKYV